VGDASQGNSREQLELDKRKIALEESFAKKWAVPLLTLAGVIIAGVLSTAGVWITSIQKDTELRLSDKQKRQRQLLPTRSADGGGDWISPTL